MRAIIIEVTTLIKNSKICFRTWIHIKTDANQIKTSHFNIYFAAGYSEVLKKRETILLKCSLLEVSKPYIFVFDK